MVNYKKIFVSTFSLFLLCVNVFAQSAYEHHINRIAVEVADDGALLYRQSSSILQATWPYDSRYFDASARKNYQESYGLWIGTRDFLGVNDTVASTALVACGNFYKNSQEITKLSLKKRVKYKYPTVTVEDGSSTQYESFDGATVVSSLSCDEQIESVWTTTLGVTVQLTTYAYSSGENKNYIIYSYRFLNTGNVDDNTSTRELSKTLKDVYFGISFSTDIKPRYGGQDADDRYNYYGTTYPDYVNGNPVADSARVLCVWDGDAGTGNFDPDPVTYEPRVPGYYGIGVLHADKQAVDDLESGSSDDPAQPVNVVIADPGEASASSQYQKLAQGGNDLGSGYGAQNFIMSFGPYDIPVNEDVRIVLVQIIDGISVEKSEDLGMQLLAGNITQDQYEAEVETGLDSLFRSYNQAKIAYENNYNIPDPPPAPDSLRVTNGIGAVTLNWSSSAETIPDPDTDVIDFSGYRIYRVAVTPENQWEQIYECGGSSGIPVTHTYVDTSVIKGFNYYYAVTAFDDGTQNFLEPGKSLESSKLASTAYIGASASVPAQQTASGFQEQLRVVPNPFNIRSQNYGDPNDYESLENNKLLFVGLPGVCTIRIYTVAGDLVKVLQHTNGLGSESWDQITDYNQYITSGLYIAHVESDLGDAIIKFVVIR